MATAFGPEGCVIMHMLAAIDPSTYVFNLDTGYQFKETLELRGARSRSVTALKIDFKQADTTVEQYEALHGGPLYKTNSDQCCFDRKVKVLRQVGRGLAGLDERHPPRPGHGDRAGIPIVGWDKKFGLVKISPLANWTKKDVWKLIIAGKHSVQSAARSGLHEHRLLAVHAGRDVWRRRAGRPLERLGQEGVRLHCRPSLPDGRRNLRHA